jgi:hypothetical protein
MESRGVAKRPWSLALALVAVACVFGGGVATVAGWQMYRFERYRLEFLEANPEVKLSDSEMESEFGRYSSLVLRSARVVPLLLMLTGALLVIASVGLLAHRRWGLSLLALAGWAGIVWFCMLMLAGALVMPEAEAVDIWAFVGILLSGIGLFGMLVVASRAKWLKLRTLAQ